MSYQDIMIQRRSIYNLNKDLPITDSELLEMVRHNLKHTPSAYNSQSQRMMVLFGARHDEFWELVREALRKIVPEKSFSRTSAKIDGFKAAYGTLVFFDEQSVTNDLIEKFPLYKKNFEVWAEQQNGMLQVNLWNAFAEIKIGASLQHYTEVIDEAFRNAFEVPKTWRMMAQMPFGGIVEPAGDKSFVSLDERLIVPSSE